MKQLEKHYDFTKVEKRLYKMWEEKGHFKPAACPPNGGTDPKKKPFTIIMPPPNANGSLHLGHAVFVALEDLMTRYNRMLGRPTLWLPGFDHAGFETQTVYEKKLEKQGTSRFSATGGSASGGKIPRDELYKQIYKFTIENKDFAKKQLQHLGASADWSREKFTLEPDIVSGTQDTFVQMYKDGLIYRGNRLVNWCVKHQTGLSDVETKTETRIDPLYYIKYGPITLATVRPETVFGDTAIAVNPKDSRYKKYIGTEINTVSILGPRKLKVIGDASVDKDFGTGAVKITPAHDPADFDMWQAHKKEINGPLEVINCFGKMNLIEHFGENEITKKYEGLKITEARKQAVEDLKKLGLIEKIDEKYEHNITLCYKCNNILEPRLLPQWYVAIKRLAEPAIKAVEKGQVEILPARYKKVYLHWMRNIRDWNISRQIVWGIRIPAWQCQAGTSEKRKAKSEKEDQTSNIQNDNFVVAKEKPKRCPFCGRCNMEQDQDVFDTWFSSGQWPYLALGYPDSEDFKTFYPTSVLETGWDILFFWVARMIMFGLYRTGKSPFHTVYLHGLVRDKDRVKMSKSKGNVLDPLGVAETYGSDAVRMALTFGTGVGNDAVISEEKIKGFRNFTNKVWNASRFILMNLDPADFFKVDPKALKFTKEDKWILEELEKTTKKITSDIEKYNFHHGAEEIYHFFWHKFCDKTIEDTKKRLQEGSNEEKQTASYVLLKVLRDSLKLMHPFMPFITEEIWQTIKDKSEKDLIVQEWPK